MTNEQSDEHSAEIIAPSDEDSALLAGFGDAPDGEILELEVGDPGIEPEGGGVAINRGGGGVAPPAKYWDVDVRWVASFRAYWRDHKRSAVNVQFSVQQSSSSPFGYRDQDIARHSFQFWSDIPSTWAAPHLPTQPAANGSYSPRLRMKYSASYFVWNRPANASKSQVGFIVAMYRDYPNGSSEIRWRGSPSIPNTWLHVPGGTDRSVLAFGYLKF